MRKISYIVLVGILLISIVPSTTASDEDLTIEQQIIEISIGTEGLHVEENLVVNNSGIENATLLRLWIQQNAEEVRIRDIDSGEYLILTVTGNIRECNLTNQGLEFKPKITRSLKVTYILQTDTTKFEKSFTYDTDYLSISFENRELVEGEAIASGSSSSVLLYRPTEAPLDILYLVGIFLLAVILIASTLLLLKKQRTKEKRSVAESKEILTTKKTLLLSILKDVEKKHRAKEISDDTYQKVKDEYKQQAVTVMKKLEEAP